MGVVNYTVVNGEILSENRNGVKRDYVPDALGSTVALLDNAQTVTDSFEYFPYGELRSRTGTTPTPFQFVGTKGYYRDSASRTYSRSRELDIQIGRLFSPNAFGLGTTSKFTYPVNSPLIRTRLATASMSANSHLRGVGQVATIAAPPHQSALQSCAAILPPTNCIPIANPADDFYFRPCTGVRASRCNWLCHGKVQSCCEEALITDPRDIRSGLCSCETQTTPIILPVTDTELSVVLQAI